MTARSAAAAISARRARSEAATNDPVGLFGFTSTSTRARPLLVARLAPARASAADQAVEVDVPVAVVGQAITHRPNPFQSRQVVEERIARLWDQHGVARIAEQLEQQRVRLAGAGGDHDLVAVDRGRHRTVTACDRFARRCEAQWRRIVTVYRARAERVAQCLGRVREAHARRIRFGQVDDGLTGGAARAFALRERVLGAIPGQPCGKHCGSLHPVEWGRLPSLRAPSVAARRRY